MINRNIATFTRIVTLLIAVIMMVLCFNACVKEKPKNYTETPQITDKPTPTQTPVPEPTNTPSGEIITITYLDVGQGDSAFIELPGGKTMLIDASESKASDDIISFISGKEYKRIDYLVATHSDADHIGGFIRVLDEFDVSVVYRPFTISTSTEVKNFTDELYDKFKDDIDLYQIDSSKDYAQFLKLAYNEVCGDKLCEIKVASNQETIISNSETEPYLIKFFMPEAFQSFSTNRIEFGYTSLKKEDNNDVSAVVEIITSTNKYLFMGDLTTSGENLMISMMDSADREMLSDIDILKVGYHGSETSTSEKLLAVTRPKNSVIMCEADNEYGFPKESVLNLLNAYSSVVYRTDKLGTIIATEKDGGIIFSNIETINPLLKWKVPLYILIGFVVVGIIVLIAVYPKIKKKKFNKKSDTKLIKVVDKNEF